MVSGWERKRDVVALKGRTRGIDVEFRDLGEGRGHAIRFVYEGAPFKLRTLTREVVITNIHHKDESGEHGWTTAIMSTRLIPWLASREWKIRANEKRQRGRPRGELWSFKISGGRGHYPYAGYSASVDESYELDLANHRGVQRLRKYVDVSD